MIFFVPFIFKKIFFFPEILFTFVSYCDTIIAGRHSFIAKLSLTLLRPYGLYMAPHAFRSMGFPRQEYWSWLPFPSPGDLPDPEIKPKPPSWQADSLPLSHL